MILLSFGLVYPQRNTITLKSLLGGSEGDTLYTDSSTLSVSATRVVSYSNSSATNDWGVTASTGKPSGSLNKTFEGPIWCNGMVNTIEGSNCDRKITDSVIDLAFDGAIGL